MAKRIIRRLLYIAVPTAAASYGVHLGLNHLEEKYPSLPPKAASSKALRTPDNPCTQLCAYTDIYAARVPVSALQARTRALGATTEKSALEDAWAQTLLQNPILKIEASLAGLATRARYEAGDLGDSENGFAPYNTGAPRELMNGIFVVRRAFLRENDGNGLLLSWKVPDNVRLSFEKMAAWGYPWRLMSGGRHEFSVSEPFEVKGEGRVVEVRFASTHDYEIVESEGDQQKIIPAWTLRIHRGYARLLLDMSARELQASN
ncbi:hypothetical protein N7495_009596 [Penicillium taxi]|uniref:uncharacterized protein n=1 Tax=Penicillium taxi TaxID=168475 RepID=UPI0025458900|nr:uncharacterized protein N7495_009596 [Penicillium taxi]KAJ5885086.1 hypothetical protein N7495_009596 [Penicillium taxi]